MVGACRNWYDKFGNNDGQTLCCQGISDTENGVQYFGTAVYQSTGVEDAETFQVSDHDWTPWAEVFETEVEEEETEAAIRLGGAAALVSAAIFMS